MTSSTGRAPKKAAKPKPKFHLLAPEVARLAADGCSRNEIARRLAVAPSTVTRAAAVAGVEFDRGATDPATRASAHDRREQLRQGWQQVASLAVEQLLSELRAGNIDGHRLATVAAIATDKAVLLEPELDPAAESREQALRSLDDFMAAVRGSVVDLREVAARAVPPDAPDPTCALPVHLRDREDAA